MTLPGRRGGNALQERAHYLPSSLRFSKAETSQYEDQSEPFPYFFRGFTIGKIVTVLGSPKPPQQIGRLLR